VRVSTVGDFFVSFIVFDPDGNPTKFFLLQIKNINWEKYQNHKFRQFPVRHFFYELALKKVSLLISHILVSCRDFGLLINLCLHKNESSSLVKGRILW